MTIPSINGPNDTPKSTFWREQDFPGQATAFNLEVDAMRVVLGKETELAVGDQESIDTTGITAEVRVISPSDPPSLGA